MYKFRVSAQNEKGWSQASQPVALETSASLCGPPGCPYSKERATPSSLQISWSSPTHNGGADVQSYILQMNSDVGATAKDSGEMVDVYTGPECSYLAVGLFPGKKYQFQVGRCVDQVDLTAIYLLFSHSSSSVHLVNVEASLSPMNTP